MATIFAFFGLSRELRNSIYRELARQEPTTIRPLAHGCHGRVKPYIEPPLLLVSKPFKAEYEHEVYRDSKLKLSFNMWHIERDTGLPEFKLPGTLSENIVHFELEIRNGRVNDQQDEKDMLMRACDLPNIRTLETNFVVPGNMVNAWFWDNATVGSVNNFFASFEAFSDACASAFRNIKVYTGVYVHDFLFEPLIAGALNDLGEDIRDIFENAVRDMPGNFIVYEASPSDDDDPYPFYGLRLETVAGGYFDVEKYDALVAQVLAATEAETEEESEAIQEEEDTEEEDSGVDSLGNLRDFVVADAYDSEDGDTTLDEES